MRLLVIKSTSRFINYLILSLSDLLLSELSNSLSFLEILDKEGALVSLLKLNQLNLLQEGGYYLQVISQTESKVIKENLKNERFH
jgi:hypothetical protein